MSAPQTPPSSPLIAGVAQQTWRGGAPGPVEMLAQVVTEAAADSGAGKALLDRADALGVVKYVSAEHVDPARMIADQLGIDPRLRIHTTIGGDTPQALVGQMAGRIAAGELDIAVLCGCEALSTYSSKMKAGEETGWIDGFPDSVPSEIFGSDREPNTAEELSAGMIAPLMIYPLFEHALWAKSGLSLAEHTARLGALSERFSRVAAANPHAWSAEFPGAEAITTPSPSNRQVTFPYTKVMNANIQTDQAAAVILVSERAADELGISVDRRVYLHGAAKATEPWFVSQRAGLSSSPTLGEAGRLALAQAKTDIDGVGLLDIYSCFPSAVQIGANELGINPFTDSREPTVTGGLSFAGGPGNAYVFHSIAAMVERLREEPDEKGLVTAVGWYMTKHAVGIYGATPPHEPFTGQSVVEEPSAARQVSPTDWSGEATGEAATVLFERDGSPSMAIITAITEDDKRALANSTDPAVLDRVLDGTPITSSAVERTAEGELRF